MSSILSLTEAYEKLNQAFFDALDENKRLSSEGAIMRKALVEIAEGRGRYSMDPLEHAGNTIEDMKGLAGDALAAVSGKRE